ncbi:MAG: hypothetical protein LUG83_09860 [Lachnospiraceae bacterium]|nr:hypothetical protein [Lachnospiraceae bacterium]
MEADEISLDLEYEKRDENGKLEYEGISFVKDAFPTFLKQTISPIYKDEDYNAQMKEVAIDMTGFDSENLQAVFDTIPKVSNFRIGELVAEKIVESRYSAKFTYNSDRDLKNPNSNNTGADLVGFIEMEDGAVNFLFGEVKTSEEYKNPPGVMYGSNGMIDQLVELGTNSDKLKSLVKWIFIKCNSDKDLLVQKYITEAMQHYMKDRSSIQLIGVLVRDTNPNEMDLKNRYIDLKKRINGQHNVQLLAVYSNYKMKNGEWEKLI